MRRELAMNSITIEIEITIEITEADIIEFSIVTLLSRRTNGTTRLMRWLMAWIILMLLAIVALFMRDARPWLDQLMPIIPFLILGVLAVILILIGARFRKQILSRMMLKQLRRGKNRGMLGKSRLTLDDDGIHSAGEFSEGIVRWGAVETVISTPSAVYLYVAVNNAQIIPKRFFADEAESSRFFEFIKVHAATATFSEALAQPVGNLA
jgi:hypothetical protein